MKKSILFILPILLFLGACASGDYRSHKKIQSRADYSSFQAEQSPVTYEFVPVLPPSPSVLGEEMTDGSFAPGTQPQAPLAEDEDFTAQTTASSYGRYGDVAVNVAAKKFNLGANATQREMTLLRTAVDRAYAAALRTYHPAGFTYAMSSVGSVNPLSAVEISCLMSESSAVEVGQSTCKVFFGEIAGAYNQLVSEVK